MVSIVPSNLGLYSIPEVLHDVAGQKMYQRGQYLGKAAFAEFYELTDIASGQVFGGKIVFKQLLFYPELKNHVDREIATHQCLKHEHIVAFQSFFEDEHFMYVVLELCQKQSLMQLHQQRLAVTEPEARYFLHQLLLGVKYLHKHKLMHRHLKLGNLFLNDNMVLKIGDFGWIAKLNSRGQQIKKTLCGSPENSAPELLGLKEHSFPVDVYSMGCILYTLLVGSPPFVAELPQDLHKKILNNEYLIPAQVGPLARALISRMLHRDPKYRPTVDAVLRDPFMTGGYMPVRLPLSCLTVAPEFDAVLNAGATVARQPLGDLKNREKNGADQLVGAFKQLEVKDDGLVSPRELNEVGAVDVYTPGSSPETHLRVLQHQLELFFASKPSVKTVTMTNTEGSAVVPNPKLWISKWVDHSEKYGFGYQLSDKTIGVSFRDATKMLLLADNKTITCVGSDGVELDYTVEQHPPELSKKVKLLSYFRSLLLDHNLIQTGASIVPRSGDEHVRSSFLRQWFRNRLAVVMHMSCGTLQINFFKNHVKLILSPATGAVTVIDKQKNFRTFKLSLLAEHGCTVDLYCLLNDAHDQLRLLQEKE